LKKLVKESFHDFQRGIPLTNLLTTFRDAIHVTRKLGINYLWIDALCVIQDSREDWLVESSKMGDTYVNSYISLAATASADSHGGLFRPSNPLAFVPCQISVSLPHQSSNIYLCVLSNQSNANVNKAYLNSRAWVFQERALAPRTVHFAQDQSYWQCSSMVASHCFPRGHPSAVIQSYNIRGWKKFLTEATRPRELYDSWTWIIHFYAKGNLSYSNDKLVALAGIAKQWAQLSGCPASSYLAGLWKSHMPYCLCWFIHLDNRSTRPAKYRAPTWSWTSIDGPIIMTSRIVHEGYHAVEYAEVTAAQTTTIPSRLAEYSPVIAGFLHIRGYICEVQTAMDIQQLHVDEEIRTFIIVDEEDGEKMINIWWDEKSVDMCPCLPERELYLLVVLRNPAVEFEDFLKRDQLFCLIIQATGDGRGQYRRVGLFKAKGFRCSEKLLHASKSTSLPEELYQEIDEEMRYTIEIV
jgi:hypothetical protein